MDEGIREEGILGERHSMNKSQERGDRQASGRSCAWEHLGGGAGCQGDAEGSGELSVHVQHKEESVGHRLSRPLLF